MKPYFVYLLFSQQDKKTYVGSTDNLDRRLEEHNKGLCKSTKYRRPLTLLYKEEYPTLIEARKREKYFKTASGRRMLKIILNSRE